jgi:hypothetical protein
MPVTDRLIGCPGARRLDDLQHRLLLKGSAGRRTFIF